jgi:VWFA-related protein
VLPHVVLALITVTAATVAAQSPDTLPLTNRRPVLLIFDLASMAQDHVDLARQWALRYLDHDSSASDLIAVVTLAPSAGVVSDFTTDRASLRAMLAAANWKGLGASAPAGAGAVRLAGLETICQSIAAMSGRKSILYFSTGMQNDDATNGAPLRAATNACNRADASIYPVDARGLTAAADARTGAGGMGLFQGRQN